MCISALKLAVASVVVVACASFAHAQSRGEATSACCIPDGNCNGDLTIQECDEATGSLLVSNVARHYGVVMWGVVVGEDYYIRIAGTYFSRGTFQLDLVGPPCLEERSVPQELAE